MRRVPISVDCIPVHLIGVMFASLGLMVGCATSSTVSAPSTAVLTEPVPFDPTRVVRQGRYALVELTPERAQDELMQQLMDITFPAVVIHSVADALRYLLLRSGYRLSDDCDAAHVFDALPLPAAHAHLGPLTLHGALQVLIGPGWQLQRDDASRVVCFARSNSTEPTAKPSPATTEHSDE